MEETPETRFAVSGDGTHIAYQVSGGGDLDLVFVPPGASHLDLRWEEPSYAGAMRRLGAFARVICLDKRGCGLSDRTGGMPTAEEQVEDIAAVLKTADAPRPYLFGCVDGAASSMLFAAQYPERVSGLVLYAAVAKGLRSEDYPIGMDPDTLGGILAATETTDLGSQVAVLAPSMANDPSWTRWWVRYLRAASSPREMLQFVRVNLELDIRPILPSVRVPTLVLNRVGDALVSSDASRYVADHIPGARYVELPGNDYFPWVRDCDELLAQIEQFVTGRRPIVVDTDRVLTTVLFTDIVGSTAQVAGMGDRRWRSVLDEHDGVAIREVERFRGRMVKTTGDGVLAIFDGPARAIRCAQAIGQGAAPLGLQIRAGLHTGEIERRGKDVSGVAVHLAQRVCGLAAGSEVLVSRTIVDLVAGSAIEFEDRGEHELKGVPGRWRLYSVEA